MKRPVLLAALLLLAPMARADAQAPQPAPAGAQGGAPAAAPAPAAAASPGGPAAAPLSQDELVVGEMTVLPYGRSASYGPTRVRGPLVNLTDVGTGEWKGNVRDLNGIFKVTEKRISGGNLNLIMDRDGEEWTCQGTVDGKRVRFEMTRDGFSARYDNRLYDLKRVAPDLWASIPTGPGLRVKGDAGRKDPLYPQFIFALLSTL